MKNPRFEPGRERGRFWCWHRWELDEKVGFDWWSAVGATARFRCEKCGKVRWRGLNWEPEIPDEMIDPSRSHQGL